MEEEDISTAPRAFPIVPEKFHHVDLTVPPKTAQEYLYRVMNEAKENGYVVLPSSFPEKWRSTNEKKVITNPCPSKYLVSRDIQDIIISDFSHLRLVVSNYKLKYSSNTLWLQTKPELPELEKEWFIYCYGKQEIEENIPHADDSTCRPLLKIMIAMSQPKIWSLLEYHLSWLESGNIDILRSSPWIYALLVCLELPFTGEIFHIIRELARYLIEKLKDVDSIHNEVLYSINVIAILITRYFRQFDLLEGYRQY